MAKPKPIPTTPEQVEGRSYDPTKFAYIEIPPNKEHFYRDKGYETRGEVLTNWDGVMLLVRRPLEPPKPPKDFLKLPKMKRKRKEKTR